MIDDQYGGAAALGATLRRVRLVRGLSIAGLAGVLGCSPSVVHSIEAGRRPNRAIETLVHLALALDVSVSVFAESFALPLACTRLPDLRRAGRRRWGPVAGTPAMGAALRELRHEQGLSLTELGRRSGVGPCSIGAVERGDVGRPTILTTCRVAGGLAADTARRVEIVSNLARVYAGEEEAPVLRRLPVAPGRPIDADRRVAPAGVMGEGRS